jgi:23S rRNA (cytosine1962-C5)-methyltransferase
MLKVKLTRNLRRNIMRGHPWVFKESVAAPAKIAKAQLCQVSDVKGELAWAIFDPHSPLCLRILSTEKNPPSAAFLNKRFSEALSLRRGVMSEQTNAFRLFNGEGDGLPGLVCDVYGKVAVVQFDGLGPSEFWDKDMVAKFLMESGIVETVVEKTRRDSASKSEKSLEHLAGAKTEDEITAKENGVIFKIGLEKGQKTGFFLDQRPNRQYIREMNGPKRLLNLFSYTGGFSVYAGLGGAEHVASVDVAKGAILLAEENWELNGLKKSKHSGLCVDVFEYLEQDKELWDHIIVDPPSMSHSESGKQTAVEKYIDLFAKSAKRVRSQGFLSLSSCSSHITFEDLSRIADEALSKARRRGRILRISGQGPDHPFPQACPELRYLKFMDIALD